MSDSILELFTADDLPGLAKVAEGSALCGPANRICAARRIYADLIRQTRARSADLLKRQAAAAATVEAIEDKLLAALTAAKAEHARITAELAAVREDTLLADSAAEASVTPGDVALVLRELARWRELLASFRK